MNNVTLGYLRLQAQDRADMQSNPSITDAMWNEYISKSSKELEDLMIGAYGNDYFGSLPYLFTISGNQQYYPLSDGQTITSIGSTTILPAFYKLTGVDLQYSASPTGWVTLRKFEFIERNKNNFPSTSVNLNGYTNLRYKLAGNNKIEFNQVYIANQVARVHFIPEPPNLVWAPCVATTIASNIVVATDVTGLSVGMSIYANSSIPDGTTITAINTTTNQLTLSNLCLSSIPILVVQCWRDDTLLQGALAGWEEYVIVDAAIKAGIKSENMLEDLKEQKAAMKARVESMAEGRDAGQASHVSDVMSVNAWGDGGNNWDGGFGGDF